MSDSPTQPKRRRLTDEERREKLIAAIKEIDARSRKKAKEKRMGYIQIFALIGAGYIASKMNGDENLRMYRYFRAYEFQQLTEFCKDVFHKELTFNATTDGEELPEELKFVAFKRRRVQKKEDTQTTV